MQETQEELQRQLADATAVWEDSKLVTDQASANIGRFRADHTMSVSEFNVCIWAEACNLRRLFRQAEINESRAWERMTHIKRRINEAKTQMQLDI